MPNIIPITDFSAPELDVYARLSEIQLYHYREPDYGIFIAESPKVIERALDQDYVPVSMLVEEKDVDGQASQIIGRCQDIPVYTASLDVLTQLVGFHLTRGILCAMRRRELPAVSEVCAHARRIAVLERIMNPTNVGAVFRSAAALGMDAVVLTPLLHQSPVPPRHPGQHGNRIPDSLDVPWPGSVSACFKGAGLSDCRHGAERAVRKHR